MIILNKFDYNPCDQEEVQYYDRYDQAITYFRSHNSDRFEDDTFY